MQRRLPASRGGMTQSLAIVKSALSALMKYTVDLAQEEGASTWLTALPLEEFGFSLHKGAFRDALALRCIYVRTAKCTLHNNY